ncbi:MAG: thioredoxin [Rhizobiaceae bacterium]
MTASNNSWSADPLVWGQGANSFEIFLEPTCPFSARAFAKLDGLLELVGPEQLTIRIWLQSQPWHLFSGIICRAIVAASTGPDGRQAARQVMAAIFEQREAFEFEEHRTGRNLDVSPNQLIARIEEVSGVEVAEGFQISGLEKVVKQHTRYARQNGIHESPTFVINGLVNPSVSSGDSIEQWRDKILAT